jgi:hypothetical protein
MKLRELGEPIYSNITAAALEISDGFMATHILQLFDLSKGDQTKLRESIMKVWDNYPNYGNMLDLCYKIFAEIGTSDDVSAVIAKGLYYHYSVPLFRTLANIAEPSQLPEIEKAAEEVKRQYFERYEKVDVQYHEQMTKRWNEELKPEIDNALKRIRERQ